METPRSSYEIVDQLDQWPAISRLERAFLREFLQLGIEVGTKLMSSKGTLREVKKIIYSKQDDFEDLPVAIETKILTGNFRGKVYYTVREAAIGARMSKFSVVRPVVRWTEALEESKKSAS
jgi:hypothetical protein